jgi:hypothetical protein
MIINRMCQIPSGVRTADRPERSTLPTAEQGLSAIPVRKRNSPQENLAANLMSFRNDQ